MVKSIQDNVKSILKALGEDCNREGLQDTPRRVEKAYKVIFGGYEQKVDDIMTVFKNESKIDQIVGLSNIEYYSTCEHHMLPFYGKAHIYYIPNKTICGISKLARILDIFARRLQNQERLAKEVADTIEKYLKPKAVAVILEAEHFCMKSRGVAKQCAVMKTSDLRGDFRKNSTSRDELFSLINKI